VTAKLELGDEYYSITDGQVQAMQSDDVLHSARAEYFTTVAPAWLGQAQRDGAIDSYVPDRDCALARVIAMHLNGRFSCDQAAATIPEGVHP
jgi:hypothetical protein